MRVAVVGCGRMGRERAKAADSFGVEKLLLFDEFRDRAELLVKECPSARVADRIDSLFEDSLDALFICTPPFCRGLLEMRAIASGIPFFVEKPIGVNAGQLKEVVDSLKGNDVLNAVGYMNRYRSSVSHAREILHSCTVIGGSAHWVGRKYQVPWWNQIALSGGPFNEQATHVVDLYRYLAGGADPIYAALGSTKEAETTVLAALRLPEEGIGSFLYSCEAKEKDIFMIIETTEGVLELRGWDLDLVRNTIDGTEPQSESKPIFEKETHVFLKAVHAQDASLILADFRDAFQTQLVMDRIVGMIRSQPNR
jgi:myo-inositol 2-dehydrogenase / D-chiro-inositol 1-dehydrogenase